MILIEYVCYCFWRLGHRVFKKSSSNGKITVYLGKRDFVDHISHVDPIDGVVLIDPDYVKDRKVFGNVLAAFRYGREDLDVLGLTFRKDLYLAQEQVQWNSIGKSISCNNRYINHILKFTQHSHSHTKYSDLSAIKQRPTIDATSRTFD